MYALLRKAPAPELHETVHAAHAAFSGFSVLRVSALEKRTIVRAPFAATPEAFQQAWKAGAREARKGMLGLIAMTIAPYMCIQSTAAIGEGDAAYLSALQAAWVGLVPRGMTVSVHGPWQGLVQQARNRVDLWLRQPEAGESLLGLSGKLYLEGSWDAAQWNELWTSPWCAGLRPPQLERLLPQWTKAHG